MSEANPNSSSTRLRDRSANAVVGVRFAEPQHNYRRERSRNDRASRRLPIGCSPLVADSRRLTTLAVEQTPERLEICAILAFGKEGRVRIRCRSFAYLGTMDEGITSAGRGSVPAGTGFGLIR